ncbi:hypothetical protein V8F20_007565 [Naviculisporaceae sp. PSN 640]
MFPQHRPGRPGSLSSRSRSSFQDSGYYSDYPRSDLLGSYTSRSSLHDGYQPQARPRMQPYRQAAAPKYSSYRSIATSPRTPLTKRFSVGSNHVSSSTAESPISENQIPSVTDVLLNLYRDILRLLGHLREFSLTTKIIASSVTLVLAAPLIFLFLDSFITVLGWLITTFTPLKYIFPQTRDRPSPPHPDDLAAAAVKASLRALEVGIVVPRQAEDTITAAAATSTTTAIGPFHTWLFTTTLLAILSIPSLRHIISYWLSRPLHLRGNAEPIFPKEATISRFGQASPYWMTITYFNTRPEILGHVMQRGVLISSVFCAVDFLTQGGLASLLGLVLGLGLPAVGEIYLFFVGFVWTVNHWDLVTFIVRDVGEKCRQVGELLSQSWGVWLGMIVWGARLEGVVLVGLVVICLIVRSMWESLWESIMGWWLIMTSGTLMVLADWLFDWAGASFRGVNDAVVDYSALRNATVLGISKACRVP